MGWGTDPMGDLKAMEDRYRQVQRVDGPVSVHSRGLDAVTDGRGVPVQEAIATCNLLTWMASL